jgi:hypothetical protein
MVVRMDIHGNNYMMRDDLTEAQAKAYVADLVGSQLKVHGQDYSIYSYTSSTRAQLAERLALA